MSTPETADACDRFGLVTARIWRALFQMRDGQWELVAPDLFSIAMMTTLRHPEWAQAWCQLIERERAIRWPEADRYDWTDQILSHLPIRKEDV